MAGYIEWVKCLNCGYDNARLDVNTKTGERSFYCRNCHYEEVDYETVNEGSEENG